VKAKKRATRASTKRWRDNETAAYLGGTDERPDKVPVESSANPLADFAQPQSLTRPRLVRRTLQHNVYDFLRDGLMSGRFAPGERLTVRGVAAWIGTSVMPVREAFRRLTTEGALEPLSSGATRVPVLDFAKLQDLMEIRLTVEGLAARRAATRVTEAEYQDLCAINDVVLKAAAGDDQANEARANERFHFGIYRAARSDELLRIIEHLWLQMGPYLAWLLRQGLWPTHQRDGVAYRHHKGLLDALRLRDPAKAETSLRADLSLASQRLIEVGSRLPARQASAV
jgi:DNA-binding GntR family transcriptional regulator